jgi:predicted double-glycine peptidase
MRNVAVLTFTAWLLATSIGVARAVDAPARLRLLPLPDVRQHTTYACGAGALQAVLAYRAGSANSDRGIGGVSA